MLLPVLFCAAAANAEDGYWTDNQGGSWAAGSNWDPANGIAGGADSTAYFGFGREASILANASFSIDGLQNIGNLFFTTQGAGNWSFNSGAGGSIALANTFGAAEILVTSPSLQVTLNVALAGTGGMTKSGPGTLVLGAANTYSGHTVVAGGALNVTGSVGGGGVDVTNAALGGTGVITGPVNVESGGILSLSHPLSISNSLVLHPGSTTIVDVGAAVSGHPFVQGLSHITYGGTLWLTNVSGSLSLGQNFSVFGVVPANGNFDRILPPPGPWLRWRFDPASGQISVVSSASQPSFANVNLTLGKLSILLTGGPPGSVCSILSSTNLSPPKASWAPVATNAFDMSGSFTFECLLGLKDSQAFWTAFFTPSP